MRLLRDKKLQKTVLIILAAIIVPAFVLVGVVTSDRGKQKDGSAGKIQGRKIPMAEFLESLSAVRNQARMQFGENLSLIEKNLGLESQAWERLILLKEAQRRKIDVSDTEVVGFIQRHPFFQAYGKFNNKIYSQILNFNFRIQPRVFEEQVRQNLMITKLYKEITDAVTLSDKEIADEYKKLAVEISVYYIAGLPPDFAKDITASEKELSDYFSRNSLLFKLPLSFNIEYVELAFDDKNPAELEEKVKTVYSRLTRKEPFDKVAKDNGLALKETGFFPETGPVPGLGWSLQILSLINKSKAGELLKPVQMDKSYYIMRVKERREPYVPDYATIKEQVKNAYIEEKSSLIAKERTEDCLKGLKGSSAGGKSPADFEKAAKAAGLKYGSTAPFKFSGYIEGVGASDKFWTTAYVLKDDEYSGVIEMPGGYYIIRPKSKSPLDEKKFEAEKSEFGKKLLLQKKQEYFLKFSDELSKNAPKNE